MNPKTYRKLEGVVGKESHLAALARKSLAEKGYTDLTNDEVIEKASEVHEAQMEAMLSYMTK